MNVNKNKNKNKKVYSKNDYKFLGLSAFFVIFAMGMASIYVCGIGWQLYANEEKLKYSQKIHKILLSIPIINVPLMFARPFDIISNSLIGLFLCGFMTFPEYLINISYLLEISNDYRDISFFNILQIITALFVLCIAPFCNVLVVIANRYFSQFCFYLFFF